MARRPLPLRAVRRGLRLADRPLSVLELHADGLRFRSRPTYAERQTLQEIGFALRRPETVVYDIGAAKGVYTVAAAKVTTVAQVVAFEPLAGSFATLRERTQPYPFVRCFNLALGDENNEAKIHRSAWTNTSSFLPVGELTRQEFPTAADLEGDETVRVARLDDVVAEHELDPPHVVKMDVQGFEDHVIRGGASTIEQARLCIVELSFRALYEGAPLFDEIYPLLRQLGFRLVGFCGSITGTDGWMISVDGVFERSASTER